MYRAKEFSDQKGKENKKNMEQIKMNKAIIDRKDEFTLLKSFQTHVLKQIEKEFSQGSHPIKMLAEKRSTMFRWILQGNLSYYQGVHPIEEGNWETHLIKTSKEIYLERCKVNTPNYLASQISTLCTEFVNL